MRDNLRSLIRALIEQELLALKAENSDSSGLKQVSDFKKTVPTVRRESVRQESVRLNSDEDVAAFVERILKLAAEPAGREALESGHHRFRLNADTASPKKPHSSNAGSKSGIDTVSRVEHGLLTERACRQFAADLQSLVIGRSVRVTPLAADWLRRKGITIKRADS